MERKEIKEQAKEILKKRWKEATIAMLIYGAVMCLSSWLIDILSLAALHTPSVGIIVFIASIAYTVVAVAISYNLLVYFMKFKRGEKTSGLEIFTLIPQNFKAAWAVAWGIFCKVWYYIVLAIVCIVSAMVTISVSVINTLTAGEVFSNMGGLSIALFIGYIVFIILAAIKGLYYVLSLYVMHDSENKLRGKEAVEESEKLMQNQRGKYFVLMLSFIGWMLLAGIVSGILVRMISIVIEWGALLSFVAFIPMTIVIAYMQVSTVIFYENLAGKNKSEVVTKATE